MESILASSTSSPDHQDRQDGPANEALAVGALAALTRDTATLGIVGVIALRLNPDIPLLRLRPEQLPDFYATVYDTLRGSLRDRDRVLRTDRFEWIILLPGLPSPAALTLAMLRLTRCFETPESRLLKFSSQLDARCGGVLFPEISGDAIHLIQSARIACIESTSQEFRYAIFSPELETQTRDQLRLAQEIAATLNAGGFELYLQPKILLESGACNGAELLLRWRRNNDLWVPPPAIIAVVERAGLRPMFNRWLFNRAMQMAKSLSESGIDIPLSVNLAAGDLQDADLAMLYEQARQTFGVDKGRIQVEITETALVNQTEAAHTLIAQLQQFGVALSIDDFGTGYSGMTHLRQLPVSEIKIDQMFVRNLAESEIDQTIVRAILDLGRRLQVAVIAEGVENKEAARVLHEMGCRSAQGYLYGRPMPFPDFLAWYQARSSEQNG